MSDQITVMFFRNGTTGVFKDHKQMPELQQSWFLKFMEFLEANGIDPTTCEIYLPDTTRAKVFKTEDGHNYWLVK